MSSNEALLWLAPAVLLLAAAWFWLKRATSGRMQPPARKRFPRAKQLHWEPAPGPVASPPGMPPAYLQFIRRDAEEAARRTCLNRAPEPANPYPAGTREFVVWGTSFHIAMTELAEPPAPPSSAPAPL